MPSIFVSVHSGEGGVLWRRFWGGTELDWSYGEGTAIVWPWDKVHIYDLSIQQLGVEESVYTSDGLHLRVSVSARFRIDREGLPRLHRELGPRYIDKLVKPELTTAARLVLGRYDSKQVYTRGERSLLDEIRSEFRARLEGQPVEFVDVLLVKMTIPDRVQEAIQDKLVHEQEAIAYKFILEREEQEKQRRIIEAQGVRAFASISEISAVQWKALETTAALAGSSNAKIVIMGNDATSLPVLLGEQFVEASAGQSPTMDHDHMDHDHMDHDQVDHDDQEDPSSDPPARSWPW
ncbi:MAG: prohibitin family protein [Myxococcota bacterium]